MKETEKSEKEKRKSSERGQQLINKVRERGRETETDRQGQSEKSEEKIEK